MLDLKFVRENPEIVKQNIRNKFQDHKLPLVDEVIELISKAVRLNRKPTRCGLIVSVFLSRLAFSWLKAKKRRLKK